MKNKIIKTVCFSLLALSVALCAVFTLPKNDNLNVNASTIQDDSISYFPVIPYNGLYVRDLNINNYVTNIYLPFYTSYYISPTYHLNNRDEYFLSHSGIQFNFYYAFSSFNTIDDIDMSAHSNLVLRFKHGLDYSMICDNISFTAYNFVLPIYNNVDSSPSSSFLFMNRSNLSAYTSSYTITLFADFAINGDFIENNYIRITGSSELALVYVYKYIQGYFRNNYLFDDILYIYVRDLSVVLNFDTSFDLYNLSLSYDTTIFSDYANDLNVIAYYDSFETTKIEYELNLFQTLIRTVHEFMSTEFLPNVSFYDLLLYVLVIPLVIMLLKMWLGG